MARLTRDEIVAQLTAKGLHFRAVVVETEGTYRPTDVDWNLKDVHHTNHVHRLINDLKCIVDEDLTAAVSLQTVLGIPFPVVLVVYDAEPDRVTHFFTLLAWTVVSDIELIEVSPTRTRAVTTYMVGSNRLWMLFFPVIGWVLRRNFRELMAEDLPMRERRGRLRALGYAFRNDSMPRDIRKSLALGEDNVIPPEAAAPSAFAPVPVAEITEDDWTFVGTDDHLGLRLQRQGDQVLAFPRMCLHDGAAVDAAPVDRGCLTCPWHGRRLPPLAVLDLTEDQPAAVTTWHQLQVDGDELRITTTPAGETARPPTRRVAQG